MCKKSIFVSIELNHLQETCHLLRCDERHKMHVLWLQLWWKCANSLSRTIVEVCNAPWALQWRYNGRDGASNHQPHDGLLKRLFRSKKTSKLRVTGLCVGNSLVTGEFPIQMASNAENVPILLRHHAYFLMYSTIPLGIDNTRLRPIFLNSSITCRWCSVSLLDTAA